MTSFMSSDYSIYSFLSKLKRLTAWHWLGNHIAEKKQTKFYLLIAMPPT